MSKLVAWVDPALKREIERIANAEGRSVSNLLRRHIERIAAEAPLVTASPVDHARRITDATRRLVQDAKRN
jgi:hypothetical protein